MKLPQNGFTLIELLIVIVILSIIAAIAIPNLMAARRSANEAAAVSSMRSIVSAETTYRTTIGHGNFGDMTALIGGGLLDGSFTSMTRTGYDFALTKVDESAGQPPIFNASAIPVQYGTNSTGTGSKSFYTNETGVIYFNYLSTAPFPTSNLDRTVNDGGVITN
ncbi:MAG TPA: prepilin-type N-terminal cleavage/methylation domain-containing protein [Pyrinomonadaceae bacterium]|nr:prepilin-type N-terminal cleavage/methylation domain-containing protein [Pyrinomonadaceae bacterium]